jgi:hypothetical protein
MRQAKAYASIKNAMYRGQRRGYTFANYVTIHQEAHNELLSVDEFPFLSCFWAESMVTWCSKPRLQLFALRTSL